MRVYIDLLHILLLLLYNIPLWFIMLGVKNIYFKTNIVVKKNNFIKHKNECMKLWVTVKFFFFFVSNITMYLLIVFLFLIFSFSFIFFLIRHLCLYCLFGLSQAYAHDISRHHLNIWLYKFSHGLNVRWVYVYPFALTLPSLCLPLHTRPRQCDITASLYQFFFCYC